MTYKWILALLSRFGLTVVFKVSKPVAQGRTLAVATNKSYRQGAGINGAV